MQLSPDQQFEKLGLTLPPAPKPLGVYKPFLIVNNFAYVSGHGTTKEDGSLIIGRRSEERRVGKECRSRCAASFQAEDGIRDYKVTGVQTWLFRSSIT